MGKKWRKTKRSGPRARYAWLEVQGANITAQSGTRDGMVLVTAGYQLVPESASILDKARWVRLVRIIAKLLLVLTSTGAEQYIKVLWGWRIAELDNDGTLPATTEQPTLTLQASDDRRVDWLWRDSTVCKVSSTAGDEVALLPGEHPGLAMDFKPGRKLGAREGLVFHWRHVTLNTTSTNDDTTATAALDGRILISG